MPYHVKFKHAPSGYVAKSVKKGESATIIQKEFLSSEDGMALVHRLEGFATEVIDMLPTEARVKSSQVDHLLLHFDREGNATVYVNELAQIASIKTRSDLAKGQAVFDHDIVDVERLEYQGISVPPDHGVLVVFSKGWRKGLYFDFEPLPPMDKERVEDLWRSLGRCYGYLLFQEFHAISEQAWAALFAAKWFPFVGLKPTTIKEMIGWVNSAQSADEVLPKAAEEVRARLPSLRKLWATHAVFSDHKTILDAAADRFEARDWIAANSILYPRIEGVLRNVSKLSNQARLTQSELAKAPLLASGLTRSSRLLPHMFQKYLQEVYFETFDPKNPSNMSRNSVGHGVASADEFSEKAAVIGMLIVEQVFFHLPSAS